MQYFCMSLEKVKGNWLNLYFTYQCLKDLDFINECIKNGIYFAPSKFEAGFISTKHTNKEINNTISVIKEILNKGI